MPHVCQGMSAAYAKGVITALPNSAISYDRIHVVAMAADAMDKILQAEMRDDPGGLAQALATTDRKTTTGPMWGMRKNPSGWSIKQTHAMRRLEHSSLKGARAWRLKMALREIHARAATCDDSLLAGTDLNAWLSWVRRCRLGPFKKLANTTTEHAVVRGMLDN